MTNIRLRNFGFGQSCTAIFVTMPVEPCQLTNSPVKSGIGALLNHIGLSAPAPARITSPVGMTASMLLIHSAMVPCLRDKLASPSSKQFATIEVYGGLNGYPKIRDG